MASIPGVIPASAELNAAPPKLSFYGKPIRFFRLNDTSKRNVTLVSATDFDLARLLNEPSLKKAYGDTELIRFRPSGSERWYDGYETEAFIRLCGTAAELYLEKAIPRSLSDFALEASYLLVRIARYSLCTGAINPLTGHIRGKDYSAKPVTSGLVVERPLPADRQRPLFGPEYRQELHRLNGSPREIWDAKQNPQWQANFTNEFVYDHIDPLIRVELDRVNPKNSSGYRANKHYQHLTEEGQRRVAERVQELVEIMGDFKDGEKRAMVEFLRESKPRERKYHTFYPRMTGAEREANTSLLKRSKIRRRSQT